MARGIDHLVLAVRDLDAAGRFYEALGFRVGARNRHPWGTENRIVQFPGVFLELITVGEGAEIAPHGPKRFSFGAFVTDSLARGEGLAMLVLESRDAAADRDAFAAAGIGDFEPFFFERRAVRPDGTQARVAFSLAFARSALAPDCGFFVCQQHEPGNFWNPAFQAHPNGATGVPGVLIIAENPSEHAEFLAEFTGEHDLDSNSSGIVVPTPRGAIEVMTGPALAFHLGLGVPETPTRFIGFRVGVADLAAQEARLAAAGIPFDRRPEGLVVGPGAAFGAAIVFQPAA
ncbi:VOC family protein [Alsobacter sp. SYSU M60028]|uniref:VOC family protein n=1 Tax=Alsobacter ponti TaxID=2962936 RepID=A0ABT1L9M8_9HYPH|nr:VOC family protein [Alsobacter ponti]MCP8938190.1 VOC family protein [Alsobacter ponti]